LEEQLVRLRRDDVFLDHELERVGDPHQEAVRPDAVGADARLHVAGDLALGVGRHAGVDGDEIDEEEADGEDADEGVEHGVARDLDRPGSVGHRDGSHLISAESPGTRRGTRSPCASDSPASPPAAGMRGGPVIFEADAVHVVGLTLVPVGRLPDRDQAGHRRVGAVELHLSTAFWFFGTE